MTVPRMVVRCPVCQQVGAAQRLAVDFRGAEITCGACGASTRFPPYQSDPEPEPDAEGGTEDRSAPPTPPVDAPSEVETPEPEAPAAAAKVAAEDPRMLLAYEVEGLPAALIERYREAVRQGDGEEHHTAVVRAAAASGDLHLVGGLYRRRAERLPGDAVAEAMRERVLGAALTTLKPSDGQEIKAKARGVGRVLAVLFLLAGLLGLGGSLLRAGCLPL